MSTVKKTNKKAVKATKSDKVAGKSEKQPVLLPKEAVIKPESKAKNTKPVKADAPEPVKKKTIVEELNDKIASFSTIDDFEDTLAIIKAKNLKLISRSSQLPARFLKMRESRRGKNMFAAVMELSDGTKSKAGIDIFGRYFEVAR